MGAVVIAGLTAQLNVQLSVQLQVYPLDYKRARKQAADAETWKGREEAPNYMS